MPVSIDDVFASAAGRNSFRKALVCIEAIIPGEGVAMPSSDAHRDDLRYKLGVMKKYLQDPLVSETYATLKANIDKYEQLK